MLFNVAIQIWCHLLLQCESCQFYHKLYFFNLVTHLCNSLNSGWEGIELARGIWKDSKCFVNYNAVQCNLSIYIPCLAKHIEGLYTKGFLVVRYDGCVVEELLYNQEASLDQVREVLISPRSKLLYCMCGIYTILALLSRSTVQFTSLTEKIHAPLYNPLCNMWLQRRQMGYYLAR